jgi:hypothetical protein
VVREMVPVEGKIINFLGLLQPQDGFVELSLKWIKSQA